MSSSNCCLLTCIQVSQEAGQVVWYFHFFKNFPQFVVIHIVKGFGIVNEAEVDFFFFNFLAFSMILWILAIGSLVSLPFLNPAWTSGSSQFMYCWSLAWRTLSINMLVREMTAVECSCAVVWTFFGIAFLWYWNENWLFPVQWPLLSFPNLLACWVHQCVVQVEWITVKCSE